MANGEQFGETSLSRIGVGFNVPMAMVARLDAEAKRRGVMR